MATRKKKASTRGRGVGVLFGGLGIPRTETASARARLVSSVAHDVFPFLINNARIMGIEESTVHRAFVYAEAFVAERERRFAAAAAQDRKAKK